MESLILAIDIGTTACKVVLFNSEGDALQAADQEYPVLYPRALWAEQDPDDWWRSAVTATRRCLASVSEEQKRTVAAIGLSSQRETMAALDGDGRPLGRAILWMDRRSQPQADRVAAAFGREEIHRRTGMLPDATFSISKLMWLSEHEPDLVRRARLFLQPKEFVGHRLTGKAATEPSLASRTMMFDLQAATWIDELVAFAGIRGDQLPPLIPSDAVLGPLTKDAAEALGLPSGLPVVMGGGDRQCEALGAGIAPGDVSESTGTTSNVLAVIAEAPKRIEGGTLCSHHIVSGLYLIEQGLSTTGAILRWFRDQFGYEERQEAEKTGASPYDLMSALADARPAGANGLVLLPFFMGASATRWNAKARGVLLGLTLEHTKGDVARSLMEGVAYEIAACMDVLSRMGRSVESVRVLGGGAKARLWNQIKADISGKTVEVPKTTEAASLGAMVLAGSAVGLFDAPVETARRLNPVAHRFEPNPRNRTIYRGLRAVYEDLYQAVKPLYEKVDQILGG